MLKNKITTLLFCSLTLLAFAQKQPNILWINCDDLGRELACYGNPDVYTPNIDKLAFEGVKYTNAYSNAPVCSASRSSQILGMYPSAANVLNHRTMDKKPLPKEYPTLMQLFQNAGYFCTNGWAHAMHKPGKEDYNFSDKNLFDSTDWKNRDKNQPFFAQVQIHEPHRVFVKDKDRPIAPQKVTLPGCYPDYPLIRADWALYLESIQIADKRVGYILDRLNKEGLTDNTIVILFGDHGRPHIRDKQWLYEGGLAIPLIVRYPNKQKANTTKQDLISLVDVSVSSLELANINIPKNMHGKNVFDGEKRNYVFGFRQRCGDALDDIRSITDGRYKLIWNRMPELPYMQLTSYKKLQYPAFTLYHYLNEKGELESPYNQFMAKTRPEFELYDLKKDPNEFSNLAGSKEYRKTQKKLFKKLNKLVCKIEKNNTPETEDSIERAKAGSLKFYKKGMEKKGLPENASTKQIIDNWEAQLLQ